MAKRVTVNLNFLAYEALKPTNDPSDLIKLDRCLEDDEVSEISRLLMSIDPGSIAESVPFDGTGANYVVIHCDQALTLELNEAETTIDLLPTVAGEKTPVFFTRGLITKLVLKNVSLVAANVDIILVALPE